jgi:adenosine deaminase
MAPVEATTSIAGLAGEALASLTDAQVQLLSSLQKAELHAHLNGCIPLCVLEELASHHCDTSAVEDDSIRNTIRELSAGATLTKIDDFFSLFPAIYALTSSPAALAKATAAVVSSFLGPPPSSVKEGNHSVYLELRTTPRKSPSFSGSRFEYLQTVLSVLDLYPRSQCALIVSIDRRMCMSDVEECVDLAILLKEQGRRVVGIDLCGDPLAGDMFMFKPHFQRARQHGLKLTLHIAEVETITFVIV